MFVYVSNSNFSTGPDGGSPDDAVSVFAFDEKTAGLRPVQTIKSLRNPTYMTRHPQLPVLYVLERWTNPDKSTPTLEQMKTGDSLTAFSIHPGSGELSPLAKASTGGQSPMHVSVHPSGRYAFTANPGRPKDPDPETGHATAIRLLDNGAPGEITGDVNYEGRPPIWREQRPKTYPHSIFGDVGYKRAFVPQLMTDRVVIYDFDEATGGLSPSAQPYVQVSSGAGPRHIAFHQSGRFFYVVNSFDGTVSVFSYDAETGYAGIVQTQSLQLPGHTGPRSASHLLVSPSGRFLYCTHRSLNSMVVLSINQETGELRLVQHEPSLGIRPRDFAFDPTGKFMLVTNQLSDEIVSFHVDTATGRLRPTGLTHQGPRAQLRRFRPRLLTMFRARPPRPSRRRKGYPTWRMSFKPPARSSARESIATTSSRTGGISPSICSTMRSQSIHRTGSTCSRSASAPSIRSRFLRRR